MNKEFMLGRLHWLDMSQADLAKRMGVDKAQISRLLNGKRELKAKEVRPLAQILLTTDENILNHLGEIK